MEQVTITQILNLKEYPKTASRFKIIKILKYRKSYHSKKSIVILLENLAENSFYLFVVELINYWIVRTD